MCSLAEVPTHNQPTYQVWYRTATHTVSVPAHLSGLVPRLLLTQSRYQTTCQIWYRDCYSHSLGTSPLIESGTETATHTVSVPAHLSSLVPRLLLTQSRYQPTYQVWYRDCYSHSLGTSPLIESGTETATHTVSVPDHLSSLVPRLLLTQSRYQTTCQIWYRDCYSHSLGTSPPIKSGTETATHRCKVTPRLLSSFTVSRGEMMSDPYSS